MAKGSNFPTRTMAEDILSQEEVDALLRGVSDEVDASAWLETDAGVRSYDIGRQERIVRGHIDHVMIGWFDDNGVAFRRHLLLLIAVRISPESLALRRHVW